MGALIADRASWPEIDAAIGRGLIAVLPVGALEQHGPHLPLTTDTVLASGVAARVADAIELGLPMWTGGKPQLGRINIKILRQDPPHQTPRGAISS